jgi:DNA-binding transcriptional LysR family regulator
VFSVKGIVGGGPMGLKQFKYFQVVAKVGNISKASEQLHIAQPALSIAIQKLERELSLILFDRSKKPLALTAEGEWLLDRIDPILNQYDQLMLEIEDYKVVNRGCVRVGIPPMLGAYLFPLIFSEFYVRFPGIDLTIIEEGTLEIRERLLKEELEVGVIMLEGHMTKLKCHPITRHEIKVCVAKNHPLAKASKIDFEALKSENFILMNEQTFMRKKILELCNSNSFEPHVIFSSNQISTILGLVAQGTGIAFVLQSLAEGNEEIAAISLSEPLFIEAALAWQENTYMSKATQSFVAFISAFSSRFK